MEYRDSVKGYVVNKSERKLSYFTNILMACGGHTFSHARQNIQSFSLAIKGFLSEPS